MSRQAEKRLAKLALLEVWTGFIRATRHLDALSAQLGETDEAAVLLQLSHDVLLRAEAMNARQLGAVMQRFSRDGLPTLARLVDGSADSVDQGSAQ